MQESLSKKEIYELIGKTDLPKLIESYYPELELNSSGNGRCAAVWRGGTNPNSVALSNKGGTWVYNDFKAGEGGNALQWLMNTQGASKAEAINILKGDSQPLAQHTHHLSKLVTKNTSKNNVKRTVDKIYKYEDTNGEVIHLTYRMKPKEFWQGRPAPENGKVIWGLTEGTYYKLPSGHWSKKKRDGAESIDLLACETILYNLKGVEEARATNTPVIIVEGEKDVDSLKALGIIAACNCGGGGNWTESELQTLSGLDVVVFADNDLPNEKGISKGLKVAEEVCGRLEPLTNFLRGIVTMPHGFNDVSDYIDLGGATKDDILLLINNAQIWVTPTKKTADASKAKTNDIAQPISEKTLSKRSPTDIIEEVFYSLDPELFCDDENKVYVELHVDGHWERCLVYSRRFKQRLRRQYYRLYGKAFTNDSVLSAYIDHLDANAVFDEEQQPVNLRVCGNSTSISIDLGNRQWQAVDIDADGWRVVDRPKHKLIRTSNMHELPIPVEGGSLNELRDLFRVDDSSWTLLVGFLVMCLHPTGPYPILHLIAEQGAGKSNTAKLLKYIVDPDKTMLRTECRTTQNLFIACGSTLLPIFDNLSSISEPMSNAFCTIATGGTHATRMLYEQAEEKTITVSRPVILTGINPIATKSDLLSRSIMINLPNIPEQERLSEEVIRERLKEMLPRLLGALYSAVSQGLKKLAEQKQNNFKPETFTRMMDFERWVLACETSLGLEEGMFHSALFENQYLINEVALEVNCLPKIINNLLDANNNFIKGTATELLSKIDDIADDRDKSAKDYPRSNISLGRLLQQLKPNLRKAGINIDNARDGSNGSNVYRIYKQDNSDTESE